MEGCIFCKIVRGEIPCVKVYENEKVLAFADINPISDGHTLIIPKAHAENLWEISEADLMAIQRAGMGIAKAMKEGLKAEGVACLQLNGRAVNQVVMHYHLHLIPRLPGVAPIPMTDWKLVPGDMARIKQTAEGIKDAMK